MSTYTFVDNAHVAAYNDGMNDYELSKLADMMDEDAVTPTDFDPRDWQPQDASSADDFKQQYFGFYDDIKTNPYEDW